jgi:hypothetical protein
MEDQIRDAESEHERKLRRMETEHAAEVRSQERKHEDDLRDKKSSHRETFDKVERELKDELHETRERGRSDVRERKEKNERELEDFDKDHQGKVEQVRKDQRRIMERMERDNTDELERRKRTAETKMEDEVMDLEKSLSNKRDELERQKKNQEEEHERTMERLRQEMETKERDLMREQERDMVKRVEREIEEKARRKSDEAERDVIRNSKDALDVLKEEGREDLRRSREIHVEEMTKLESRQKEEEHRMRKRLEEIRKRGSDAVEVALAESKSSSADASNATTSTKETMRLESEVRKVEDELRGMKDTNDTLRRNVETLEDRLRRAETNFKESETDRAQAVKDKNNLHEEITVLRQTMSETENKAESAERKLQKLEALKKEKDTATTTTTTAELDQKLSEAKTKHEDVLFALKRKHKEGLRALEEKLDKKRRDDVEAAIEEERRKDQGEIQGKVVQRHAEEVQALRKEVDAERASKVQAEEVLEQEKRTAKEVVEEKKKVERKLESLEASVAAEGKGAMGRVEQMKTFRRQVSDLEEQVKTTKSEMELERDGKVRLERRLEEEERRWARKVEDIERELVVAEERKTESEQLLSAKKKEVRTVQDEARSSARQHENDKEESDASHAQNVEILHTEHRVALKKIREDCEAKLLTIKKEMEVMEAEKEVIKVQAQTEAPPPYGNKSNDDALQMLQGKLQTKATEINDLERRLQVAMTRAEEAEEAMKEAMLEGATTNASSAAATSSVSETLRFKAENRRLQAEVLELQNRLEVSHDESDVTLDKLRSLRGRVVEMETEMKRVMLAREEVQDQLDSVQRQMEDEESSYDRTKKALLKEVGEKTSRLRLEEQRVATLESDLKDMAAAATGNGVSGSNITTPATPELLLQVSRMKTAVAHLEKREKDLEDALLDARNHSDGKDDQLRSMRMELAKQKKTIQKNEAALSKQQLEYASSAPASGSAGGGDSKTSEHANRRSVGGRSTASSTKIAAWREKARAERELLGRAKKYVESQKKEIRRRQRRIERDRKDWRNDMTKAGGRHSNSENQEPSSRSRSRRQMLREIKKSLEHDSEELNQAIAHLRSMDVWLREREKKVVRLEAAAFGEDGSGNFDEESFDTSRSGLGNGGMSSSAEDSGVEAARLSEELDDDFSFMDMSMQQDDDWHGEQGRQRGGNPQMWQQYMSGRGHGGSSGDAKRGGRRRQRQHQQQRQQQPPPQSTAPQFWMDPSGFDPANQMYAAAAAAAAAAIQQQQSGYNISQPRNAWGHNPRVQSRYPDENIDANMERVWMSRGRPAGDRVSSTSNGTYLLYKIC